MPSVQDVAEKTSEQTPSRGPAGRWLLVGLGLFFVGLGAIGAFLPLLPTTPFLLLASICFVRSSPRLNRWLLRSRLFGPFLRDWQKHRGVRLHVKIVAIALLAGAVAASLTLGDLPVYLQVILVSLALIGLVVVLRLRLVREARVPVPGQRVEEKVG